MIGTGINQKAFMSAMTIQALITEITTMAVAITILLQLYEIVLVIKHIVLLATLQEQLAQVATQKQLVHQVKVAAQEKQALGQAQEVDSEAKS